MSMEHVYPSNNITKKHAEHAISNEEEFNIPVINKFSEKNS